MSSSVVARPAAAGLGASGDRGGDQRRAGADPADDDAARPARAGRSTTSRPGSRSAGAGSCSGGCSRSTTTTSASPSSSRAGASSSALARSLRVWQHERVVEPRGRAHAGSRTRWASNCVRDRLDPGRRAPRGGIVGALFSHRHRRLRAGVASAHRQSAPLAGDLERRLLAGPVGELDGGRRPRAVAPVARSAVWSRAIVSARTSVEPESAKASVQRGTNSRKSGELRPWSGSRWPRVWVRVAGLSPGAS